MTRIALMFSTGALLGLLGACGSPTRTVTTPVPPKPIEVALEVYQSGQPQLTPTLNLTLTPFEDATTADASVVSAEVSDTLRRAEGYYLAWQLSQTLERTQHWGAVRLTPRASAGHELLISGRILKSDGLSLELAVTATDSSGQVWLDRRYVDTATARDYPDRARVVTEPFEDLFHQLANDLLSQARQRQAPHRQRLIELARMRYALSLDQAAWGDYLVQSEQGLWQLNRLPADSDPVMARIDRIRDSDLLFLDTVDAHISQTATGLAETYWLWRKYRHDYTLEKQRQEASSASRKRSGPRSLAAMRDIYGDYQESRYAEQAIAELTVTFSGEVSEDVIQVDQQLVRLGGSLDQRLAQWQSLIQRIYREETGLPMVPEVP